MSRNVNIVIKLILVTVFAVSWTYLIICGFSYVTYRVLGDEVEGIVESDNVKYVYDGKEYSVQITELEDKLVDVVKSGDRVLYVAEDKPSMVLFTGSVMKECGGGAAAGCSLCLICIGVVALMNVFDVWDAIDY